MTRINANLAKLADGKTIRFLNVNDKLADAKGKLVEGMMVDDLHPILKGYQVWAAGLKPILTELLGPPPRPTTPRRPRAIRARPSARATSPLAPFTLARREPLARDVEIDILYCGVCHSDLHFARNEWGFTSYPIVPGHEIVGRVTRVGKEVTDSRSGDLAGIGCLVDSCRTCPSCRRARAVLRHGVRLHLPGPTSTPGA